MLRMAKADRRQKGGHDECVRDEVRKEEEGTVNVKARTNKSGGAMKVDEKMEVERP